MRHLFNISILIAFFGLGFLAGCDETTPSCPPPPPPVSCPTEDSCVVDYHDGAYHIIPVTP